MYGVNTGWPDCDGAELGSLVRGVGGLGGDETQHTGGEQAELEEDDASSDGHQDWPADADQISFSDLTSHIQRPSSLVRLQSCGSHSHGVLHKYLLD